MAFLKTIGNATRDVNSHRRKAYNAIFWTPVGNNSAMTKKTNRIRDNTCIDFIFYWIIWLIKSFLKHLNYCNKQTFFELIFMELFGQFTCSSTAHLSLLIVEFYVYRCIFAFCFLMSAPSRPRWLYRTREELPAVHNLQGLLLHHHYLTHVHIFVWHHRTYRRGRPVLSIVI